MTEILNNCPACSHALEVNEQTRGDWTAYRCPNHGAFNLSNTLSVILVRNAEAVGKVAGYLESVSDRPEVICTNDVGLD